MYLLRTDWVSTFFADCTGCLDDVITGPAAGVLLLLLLSLFIVVVIPSSLIPYYSHLKKFDLSTLKQ